MDVKNRMMAFTLAAITVLNSVAGSIPAQATGVSFDTDGSIEVESQTDGSVHVEQESGATDGIAVTDVDSYAVSIDMDDLNGEAVINEGTEDEQTVRVTVDDDGEHVSSVYDADGTLTVQAVLSEDNPYVLVLTEEAGSTVNIKASADDGYKVAMYSVMTDTGADADEGEDPAGFEADAYQSFSYSLTADTDTVITIGFAETDEISVEDGDADVIKVEPESDSSIKIEDSETEEETAAGYEDADVETEAESEPESESSINMEDSETEEETAAGYGDADAETEAESETEASDEDQMEQPEETEHFLGGLDEAANGLDSSDFETMRLVILADEDDIIDTEHVIGESGGIYLMQYGSVEQTMNAYVYYQTHADAVEPDRVVVPASEADDVFDDSEAPDVTADENPVSALADAEDSSAVQAAGTVIALVDTGASESGNVIDRVSLIDDKLSGGTHGDDMAACIVSQNADAKILSIRAMNDNGYGTISSIVAAMEYAISQDVEIINLSLYSKKTLMTSVLEEEIHKATEAGILVVGAAGNAGEDAAEYMPGAVEDAYIIGACDEAGHRLKVSNYGSTVDYYVVAESTSNAAALFTGYVSANGTDALPFFDLLRDDVSEPVDGEIVVEAPEVTEDDSEEAIFDPVIENYVRKYADPAYAGFGKLEFQGILGVQQVLVDASTVSKGATITTVVDGDDILSFLTSVQVVTAIYNLDDDSDYYVSYADTMHQDKTSEIIDHIMAMNDTTGTDFSDYYFDNKTGLVYIPKKYFEMAGSDDSTYLDPVQIEFLQKVYLDDSFCVASAITASVDDNEAVSTASDAENAFMYASNITVEKNLDVDTMVVSINGVPVPSTCYTYNPVTGNLGVNYSSAAIENISVYCDGRDYDQDVAAAGLNYSKCESVNSADTPAKVRLSELKKKLVYRGTVDVWNHADGLSTANEDKFGVPIYITDSSLSSQAAAVDIMEYALGLANKIPGDDSNGDLVQYTDSDTVGASGKWTIDVSSLKFTSVGKNKDEIQVQPVAWDDLSYDKSNYKNRLNIRSYCIEIAKADDNMSNAHWDDIEEYYPEILDNATGVRGDSSKEEWDTIKCVVRPLYVSSVDASTGQAYVMFTIITQQAGGQNGFGIFKVIVEDLPISLTLQKGIGSAYSSIAYLNGSINPLYADLSGAVYEVHDTATGAIVNDVETKQPAVLTTNSDGSSNTVKLPNEDHSYYLVETSAPKNYRLDSSTPWYFSTVKDSEEMTVNVTDDPVYDLSIALLRKQDPVTGTATGAVGDQQLGNALFKLSYWAEGDQNTDAAVPSRAADLTWTFKTDDNGFLNIREPGYLVSGTPVMVNSSGYIEYPVGTYYLEEIQAPYGFRQDRISNVKLVGHLKYVSDSNGGHGELSWCSSNLLLNVSEDEYLLYESGALYTDIYINKSDIETTAAQGDASLAGIQFLIRNVSSSGNAVIVNGVSYAYGADITGLSLVTDENGYADTAGQARDKDGNVIGALPVGDYTIREVATNDSYLLTDGSEHAFSISMNSACTEAYFKSEPDGQYQINMDDGTPKLAYSFRDQVVQGGVHVQKFDLMRDDDRGHGDTDMSGAEFTVINASAVFVRNKDGNDIETASVSSSPSYEELLGIANAGRNTVQVITTDAKGDASTGSKDLPYGTYYIIETKAPTGKDGTTSYYVNTEWVGKVVIREDGRMYDVTTVKGGSHDTYNHDYYAQSGHTPTVTDGDDYATRDQIFRSGVHVQKFDLMRDDDRGHGDTDLSGAQFTIINVSDYSVRNKDGKDIAAASVSASPTYTELREIADAGKNTVQVITTDAKGDASTGSKDLPYGTYYIIETKAPTGKDGTTSYYVNTEWVGKVVAREDGKVYDVTTVRGGSHDIYNHDYYAQSGHTPTVTDGDDYATRDQIFRSGIKLVKNDEEMRSQIAQGESVLSGAEFTIINASDYSVRNKDGKDIAAASVSANPTYAELRKIADAGKNTVQVITTNAKGEASTGSTDLPYGTYYIIETKSSYGYWIDETFIGKIVIRDDGKMLGVNTVEDSSSFTDLGNGGNGQTNDTVDQIARRKDLKWMKVDIDGEYKPYIPFLISAVRVDEDGTETVLESHVIVSDANGQVDTSASARPRNAETLNGFDKYVVDGKVTAEGEKLLKEASTWGIWFQGNATDYPKDAMNNSYGALYTCHYRITELQCNDNSDLGENLEESGLLYIYNDTRELDELMAVNDPMYTYHPLVDTEIELTSKALDVESNTKTVPARESVEVTDTVTYTHVDSSKTYRMETQFIDLTDDNKVLKILGTNTDGAEVSGDGTWLLKEFSPEKKSGTDTTYGEMTVSALLNTKELNGHTIMVVDYLYQYVDISYTDNVQGYWLLVKIHPDEGEVDEDQCLYVPDLHTTASDVLTGDRAGAKSAGDAIHDIVRYKNLSTNETYSIVMTLKDAGTGEYISVDEDGNPVMVGIDTKTGLIYKSSTKEKTPYGGTVEMKDFALDSSGFKDNQAVVVVEYLYRADGETGELIGEPIFAHESLVDEDQTIRWVDVCTSASDKNTADDVGTDESDAVVYDSVKLSNVIFDDNDHKDGSRYSYTIKGHLVYQKDFTDADGVKHKAGETVKTLGGTKDVVTVTCDAAGNATFTYADGTAAKGFVEITGYGMNVANSLTDDEADNSYITDNTAAIADVTVEMVYHVDSTLLEGGTVVAYEYLYHDSTGGSDVEIAKHEDITDKGQTVHYPKVRTSAVDDATKDDVGALREDASITDTVILTNLVPGRDYVVSGRLVEQETGEDFLVDGETVTQSASIHVTEDGKIESGNSENVAVTSYDKEKNEVCGTVDLVFTFDATGLEDRTCVVFEDLYHNSVKVATHSDLTDEAQTVHFPKIRTTNTDGYTKDHVATVTEEASIVDAVRYWNLVPGRTYTVSGVLMNKDTQEKLLDADGNEVTSERTFTAGDEGDGIVITEYDKEHHAVSGSIDLTFTFDASLLENTTAVAFEDLSHNGVQVTTHADIRDEDQTVHFPKLRTSAIDRKVGDEVGLVGDTVIVDTVSFWNLIPGMEYEVSGILMDKETGEPVEIDGQTVTQKAVITVQEDGSVTAAGGEYAEVTKYDEENNRVDGYVELTYELDASGLEGRTLVVFEDLYHNGVTVTTHSDLSDLAQTIHFPKIRTTAVDFDTQDSAGTVKEEATVVDSVKYENLVINKIYTLTGTLYNQKTGMPVLDEDGNPVTSSATFRATREGSDVNTVTSVDEENQVVSGEYVLTFTLDSSILAGETVVAFEDLYHNDVEVTTHSDLHDDSQSVHYPEIRTTALDSETGDHVGSIWGALINGIRRLLGETDAGGNGIPDERQANITDKVELENLVPGLTYVVSGKLYDAGASEEADEPVELLIDGETVIQAVTITVSEDGKSITASDGSKTEVTSYDEEKNSVNGSVELVYTLDSSKIQGVETVVFEDLYQDVSYTPDTNPTEVDGEDIIHTHSDWTDEGQSVSEVGIQTTAVDVDTEGHVGAVPSECGCQYCIHKGYDSMSVIHDTVGLTKLVPGMEYTITGALVDIANSDLENGEVLYLKADGTLTDERDDAYEETYTFTAEEESETHYLNFALDSDKVQGRALTVFEDIWHNDVKISSHPAGDADGWDEESFANQMVYYPTGKTNASDDVTGLHTGLADEEKTITDRVYFENLLACEEYEIEGHLVYQEDFTDADGVKHKAGDPLDGSTRRVKFTASEDLAKADYTDGDGSADVDSLTVTEYANGQKAVSGYVSLTFTVNAEDLAGATVVTFETFYNNGVSVFVHSDLNDLPQTVRIPKIQTSAKSLDLDEAAIYDENGEFRDIEIVDTVTYENLWTKAALEQMAQQGKAILYADGTAREQDGDIYDITDAASYVLKGVLMDKETGEPLLDADGQEYVVYSEPFVPETANGSQDVTFVVDAGDFVEDGECSLEGKSVVAFEDLYQTADADDTDESTHVATHHDIEDAAQDIRFPKGRTHATDGVPEDALEDLSEGPVAALVAAHDGETVTTVHEAYADENVTITDMVSFENLHGAARYTVTGTLMVVTEVDNDGKPTAWEEAKDDNGNAITASTELDTTALSDDYDASVSGYIPLTFTFSGVDLAGKTAVAFETISRAGVPVAVHADITDAPQTVFLPGIQTNASDALTGLCETLAGSDTVILDRVTYENLEAGKTYTLEGILHKQSDGSAISGAAVEGIFVAGLENQFIMADGTKVMTLDEFKAGIEGEAVTESVNAGDDMTDRVSGEVYMVIPVDTTELAGETVVTFERLYALDENGSTKEIASHEDINDEAQSVRVPAISTSATVDGGKEASASEKTTVIDTVSYLNLTPGREYTMHGVLMDKTTGKSIEVVAEQAFTPKDADGTVEMEFVFVSTKLAGRQLVVFEELTTVDSEGNDCIVAEHKDINDDAQTVTIKQPSKDTPTENIDTGDTPIAGYLAGAALIVVLLAILFVFRRKHMM